MNQKTGAKYRMRVHGVELKEVMDDGVRYDSVVELTGYRHVILTVRAVVSEPSHITLSLSPRFIRLTETGERIVEDMRSSSVADVSGWVLNLPDLSSRLKKIFLKEAEPYWAPLNPS